MKRFLKTGLKFLMIVLTVHVFSACEMEKEIDLNLPQHKSQLVVECYLVQGKPYRMTVYESAGYLDRPEPVLVPDATVIISRNGEPDTLRYDPYFDKELEKFFTHTSSTVVASNTGDIYGLDVKDARGRHVTAFTQVLPFVPIDTIEYHFSPEEPDKAYLITRFRDDPATTNHYRLVINRDSLKARVQNDYIISDRLDNGREKAIRTSYRYNLDDTVFVSLHHIEEKYYDFIRSTSDARDANGNPFAQPASVRSTVQGGLGVFTHLTTDKKRIILNK